MTLKIGIVGCGLQAATIAGYLGAFGDDYEVCAVMDLNCENARGKLALKEVRVAKNCVFCSDLETFIANASGLSGIIIGTYCTFHTPVACALEKLHIPIYVEKPVAVNREQLMELHRVFADSTTSVMVSLPMRFAPLTQKAKEIIDSGALGKLGQVMGFEETSGEVYFTTWYRDYEKTGGMFMQKAVHDIDYLLYLVNSPVKRICAMKNKVCYAGDKPYDFTCRECPDTATCPKGPLARFDEWGEVKSFAEGMKAATEAPAYGGPARKRFCPYSKDIAIEDVTACIAELENGVQFIHTQNFIVSGGAGRRGARLVGDRGVLEIDFNNSKLRLHAMPQNSITEYSVSSGALSHYGGDRKLVKEFIELMKTGKRSSCDLIYGKGIYGTMICLAARESAEKLHFIEPEKEFLK